MLSTCIVLKFTSPPPPLPPSKERFIDTPYILSEDLKICTWDLKRSGNVVLIINIEIPFYNYI